MDASWDGLLRIGWVAKGVLLTLLLMSTVSVAIIVERVWTYRRAGRASRDYARALGELLRQGKWEAALEAGRKAQAQGAHLALPLGAGLLEWRRRALRGQVDDDPDMVVAAARQAAQAAALAVGAQLRHRLPTLATIGSTAPFVGLFGTTFGIINAFQAMALTGASSMGAISAGIAEALVTTAFGLVVAVPAVWAYNALSTRAEALLGEVDRLAHEMIADLAHQAS